MVTSGEKSDFGAREKCAKLDGNVLVLVVRKQLWFAAFWGHYSSIYAMELYCLSVRSVRDKHIK